MYGIKLLMSHGLNSPSIFTITQSLVLSRLTYASPAWWGFTNSSDKARLEAVMHRAVRWGLYDSKAPTLSDICERADDRLFNSLLTNPTHALQTILPAVKSQPYNLRKRTHNLTLPKKDHPLIEKNFICRMLYRN